MPSHSGSKGVTFTMIPQRAYVDLPTQTVSTLRGMRKYSIVRARANELGGMMQTSPFTSTNERGSKCLGSTMVELMLVKILNSSAMRMSYPYDETPYEMTPSRTCFSAKGSIIRCSFAIRRIHLSDLIAMPSPAVRRGEYTSPVDAAWTAG